MYDFTLLYMDMHASQAFSVYTKTRKPQITIPITKSLEINK